MKKLILLLIILISTISISAKAYYFKSSLLTIDMVNGNGYGNWMECEVDIAIDYDANQITIYSNATQIFDINYISATKYKDYKVVGHMVTDNDNNSCILKIFIYNNGDMYIKIIYPYIIYKYKVKRYDN